MIEELGTVEKVIGDTVYVRTSVKTTCHGCSQNSHCGTGLIAKTMTNKSQLLKLKCTMPAVVGDTLKIGLPETSMLLASSLFYLVPLLTMLVSSIVGSLFLPSIGLASELWIVLFTVACMLMSYIGVRHYVNAFEQRFIPTILSVIPKDQPNAGCYSANKSN